VRIRGKLCNGLRNAFDDDFLQHEDIVAVRGYFIVSRHRDTVCVILILIFSFQKIGIRITDTQAWQK
jgi:hypothetical protein